LPVEGRHKYDILGGLSDLSSSLPLLIYWHLLRNPCVSCFALGYWNEMAQWR
jgi:hypothetical protein